MISVALDTWKLPIFRRHLDAAGLVYVQQAPRCSCHPDIAVLLVEAPAVEVAPIVEAAQREARRSKMH